MVDGYHHPGEMNLVLVRPDPSYDVYKTNRPEFHLTLVATYVLHVRAHHMTVAY